MEKHLDLVDHCFGSEYPIPAIHGLGGVGYVH